MNKKQTIYLSILCMIISAGTVLAIDSTATPNVTGNATDNVSVTTGNTAVTGNEAVTTVISVTEKPISEEEKAKVINIAINLTINIGIINPTVVDVHRDEENKENLRVRVKDNTGEIIVIVVTPAGEAKQKVENTPRFEKIENNFAGKHVSFQFTNDSILNFTLEGKLIFKSIHLGFRSTKSTILGSEFRIFDTNNNMVIIHDDTSGIITESSSGKIEPTFESVSDISSKVTGKRVDFPEIRASILSSNPGSDEVIPSVTGNIVHIIINNGRSTFVTKYTNDNFEDRVVEGIAENKIGNIVNIEAENSHDVTTFGVDTTINSVVQNTISLNVSSGNSEGKVVALKVSKDVLTNLNLKILVDGDEIKPAIDINDLFQINKLAYLITIGQYVEVLVSVPKFSEHQIIVTSAPISAAPTSMTTEVPTVTETVASTPIAPIGTIAVPTPKSPGFTAILILAVIVVVYMMKRKKSQK